MHACSRHDKAPHCHAQELAARAGGLIAASAKAQQIGVTDVQAAAHVWAGLQILQLLPQRLQARMPLAVAHSACISRHAACR
jgi:hypothetical protein